MGTPSKRSSEETNTGTARERTAFAEVGARAVMKPFLFWI